MDAKQPEIVSRSFSMREIQDGELNCAHVMKKTKYLYLKYTLKMQEKTWAIIL